MFDSFFLGLIIAIPSTRFRDINQFVGFSVQVLFFLTPIFWTPDQMHGKRRVFFEYNPLAHMLELVRQPLLGRAPALEHWVVATAFGIFLAITAFILMVLFRRRVVFWL
jgi:ABC-type polysaccharide/polyol phosphate export permease